MDLTHWIEANILFLYAFLLYVYFKQKFSYCIVILYECIVFAQMFLHGWLSCKRGKVTRWFSTEPRSFDSPSADAFPPHLSYTTMFEVSETSSVLWKCKTCSKEVTNRWHHYHSHNAKRSQCPYCPATYSRIDTLRSHLKCKHGQQMSQSGLAIWEFWTLMNYFYQLGL